MKIKFFLKGVIMILIVTPFLFPQENTFSELKLKKDFSLAYKLPDTLNTDSSVYTVKPKETVTVSKKFSMRKSPTKAVLFSLVIPGAGQFYNESYWKIPIIGGLIGYFGYEYFRQNNLYKDYRDRYAESQSPQNPSGDVSLKVLREFYRDQRDDFVWYFTIVYVLNLVDAYIDAHLFDFDVKDEKLTRFGKTDRTYRLKLNLRF
jgi:hypothetical protein